MIVLTFVPVSAWRRKGEGDLLLGKLRFLHGELSSLRVNSAKF